MGLFKRKDKGDWTQTLQQPGSPAPEAGQSGATPADLSQLPPQAREVVERIEAAFPGAQVQMGPTQTRTVFTTGTQAAEMLDVIGKLTGQNLSGQVGAPGAAGALHASSPQQDASLDPYQAAPPQPAAPPQAAATLQPPGDQVAALERLAKLHEQGALTDAEFAEAKQRLLG